MANAQRSTPQPKATSAAPFGRMEYVLNAPRDGISTQTKFVSQSVTSAQPGTIALGPANLATTDTLLSMDLVLLTMMSVLSPTATFFAKHGVDPNAFNAQIGPFSMLMEFVLQSMLNAIPLIKLQETA